MERPEVESITPIVIKPVAIVIVLGLLISCFSTWLQYNTNQVTARNAVVEASQRMARDVLARMELYEYGLSGARGAVLTAGEDGINWRLFLQFSNTRDVDEEFPGARGFGFIRRVPRHDEELFLNKVRNDGRPDFSISELTSHTQERYVIEYIEPVERNAQAVGLDIGSEGNRREAADAAMREGQTRLTGPITLVQATGEPLQSFLLLMPVYRTASTPETVEQRLSSAYGWSYAPLITREILEPLDLDNSSFHIRLSDITESTTEEAFYETPGPQAELEKLFTQVLERDVFGRRWEIEFSVYPVFVQRLNQFQPAVILAIGIFATILAASLAGTVSLNRHRKREATAQLERQVVERTADLEKAKSEAEIANAAKNRFLAVVSHEIRTPITGILGMADLLESSGLRDEQRTLLARLTRSTHTLLDLISDILDFSKIEAGQMDLEKTHFSVRQVIADTCAVVAPLASTKGNVINSEIDSAVQNAYRGDAKKYRQVLLNLLSNANKFTNGGKINVSVKENVNEDGLPVIETLVTDTGVGIDSQNHDRLFQPFVQEDSSTSRKYGGTGLGLTICKNFAELMGGRIWFESVKGKGSTFGFTVILGRGEEGKIEVTENTRNRSPVAASNIADSQSRLRVLVAEDNETTRMLMSAMLSRMGHSVRTVEHGRDAVEAYQNENYDIVLMDMQMPVMDGPEAITIIRTLESDGAHIPIIALTADALDENHKEYMAAGADVVATKPVNWQALTAEMKRLTA